ncbi:hypothetical protein LTS18_007735 [Coniosporium uncinatum]|uniref:Uncharacterized protein n=1 Tax=Coniosporium uncinatum TaxID=93489 RepID=A0ACC3DX20_9PEZI|nr:hypothetical protein LTS18_007735 [Coniosporium uncinatum]
MPPKTRPQGLKYPQRADIGNVARWYGNMWAYTKVPEGQTAAGQDIKTKLKEKEKVLKKLQEHALGRAERMVKAGKPATLQSIDDFVQHALHLEPRVESRFKELGAKLEVEIEKRARAEGGLEALMKELPQGLPTAINQIRQLDEQKEESKRLKEELARAQKKYEDFKKKVTEFSNQWKQQKEEMLERAEDAENDLNESEEKTKSLQTEIQKLKMDAQELHSQLSTEKERYSKLLASTTAVLAQKDKELLEWEEEKKSDSRQLAAKDEELKVLREQNENHSRELAAKDEQLRRLRKRIERKEKKSEGRREQNKLKDKELKTLRKRNKHLRSTARNQSTNLDLKQEENDHLEADVLEARSFADKCLDDYENIVKQMKDLRDNPPPNLDPRGVEELIEAYDAEIAYLEGQLRHT